MSVSHARVCTYTSTVQDWESVTDVSSTDEPLILIGKGSCVRPYPRTSKDAATAGHSLLEQILADAGIAQADATIKASQKTQKADSKAPQPPTAKCVGKAQANPVNRKHANGKKDKANSKKRRPKASAAEESPPAASKRQATSAKKAKHATGSKRAAAAWQAHDTKKSKRAAAASEQVHVKEAPRAKGTKRTSGKSPAAKAAPALATKKLASGARAAEAPNADGKKRTSGKSPAVEAAPAVANKKRRASGAPAVEEAPKGKKRTSPAAEKAPRAKGKKPAAAPSQEEDEEDECEEGEEEENQEDMEEEVRTEEEEAENDPVQDAVHEGDEASTKGSKEPAAPLKDFWDEDEDEQPHYQGTGSPPFSQPRRTFRFPRLALDNAPVLDDDPAGGAAGGGVQTPQKTLKNKTMHVAGKGEVRQISSESKGKRGKLRGKQPADQALDAPTTMERETEDDRSPEQKERAAEVAHQVAALKPVKLEAQDPKWAETASASAKTNKWRYELPKMPVAIQDCWRKIAILPGT